MRNAGSPDQKDLRAAALLYRQGAVSEAVSFLHELIETYPDAAVLYNLLGAISSSEENFDQATSAYRRVIELTPDDFTAHNNLGVALLNTGANAEAIECFEKSRSLNDEYDSARLNLAGAHNRLGAAAFDRNAVDEAIAHYRQALEINADFSGAQFNLGTALRAQGDREGALLHFMRAIEIAPDYAEAYRAISILHAFDEQDALLEQMQQLFDQPDIGDHARVHLGFALGKAMEDLGDHDRAFTYYEDANRLHFKEIRYDLLDDQNIVDEIKRAFTKGAHTETPSLTRAEAAPIPIFIVGMPRSGTTLVEQILASHSQVDAGGEVATFNLLMLERYVASNGSLDGVFSQGAQSAIREEYLSAIAKLDADNSFITDKLPSNFLWIGFIRKIFPEAKIVHVRRNPFATCWSCYQHFFSSNGYGYAYDLEGVALYYLIYDNLMSFWSELYPDSFYTLDYERLTENQEIETRKLLDYCSLEWEDACLEFHNTSRVVKTASADQVRMKLYQGSSEKWRHFEAHLAPMMSILKGNNPARD